MADCRHEFAATVDVLQIEKLDRTLARVRIRCKHCGSVARFKGLRVGMDLDGATVSIDGDEARLGLDIESPEVARDPSPPDLPAAPGRLEPTPPVRSPATPMVAPKGPARAAARPIPNGPLPADQTLLGAPAPPAAMTPVVPECVHRGAKIRDDLCNLCGIKGQPFEVLACALHGECSTHRKHSQVRPCITCPDAKSA